RSTSAASGYSRTSPVGRSTPCMYASPVVASFARTCSLRSRASVTGPVMSFATSTPLARGDLVGREVDEAFALRRDRHELERGVVRIRLGDGDPGEGIVDVPGLEPHPLR